MKATHTPAPWKIAGKSGNDHEAFVIDAESRSICWTTSTLDCDTDEEVITEEDKANANLIASAPELLVALETLLEDHKRMFPEAHPNSTIKWEKCIEVKQALAAISKAKGTTLK